MQVLKTEKIKVDSTKIQKDFGTITINGEQHNMNAFSDEQHYLVAQLNDLQAKIRRHKYEIAQLVAAEKVFTQTLIDSVNTDEYKYPGIIPEKRIEEPKDEATTSAKDEDAAWVEGTNGIGSTRKRVCYPIPNGQWQALYSRQKNVANRSYVYGGYTWNSGFSGCDCDEIRIRVWQCLKALSHKDYKR